MPHAPEITTGTGDSIKVGTTGTIGALMSRELEESIKHSPQASSSARRKLQTTSVSVPCSYTPKRTQLRKNPSKEPGSSSRSSSSSSSNSINYCNSDSRSLGDSQKPKPKPWRNRPMLCSSDKATIERDASREKLENKKGHAYIVEVVDLKCSSPVSSRLKKLGFSKLSESIA